MNDFFSRLEQAVATGAILPVLRPCYRPCRRLLSFDDFCQSVLLRAVEHGDSFRGQTTPELFGWLRAIGRQLLITILRRSRLRHEQGLESEPVDAAAPTPEAEVSDAEERQEKTRWLAKVLTTLTAEERNLLVCHYYRQESLADIARRLGLAANTVAQRHARLLRHLRGLRES